MTDLKIGCEYIYREPAPGFTLGVILWALKSDEALVQVKLEHEDAPRAFRWVPRDELKPIV